MKTTPLQFCGRLLGSIICCVLFAIAGFFTGLAFPWLTPGTVNPPEEEI